MNWSLLESLEDLENALQSSVEESILIFKHSTRCPVSSMAKRKLESQWNDGVYQLEVYFLDLIKYRNVSNHIAENLNVYHQSPQLILVKSGVSIGDQSHHMIDLEAIIKNI